MLCCVTAGKLPYSMATLGCTLLETMWTANNTIVITVGLPNGKASKWNIREGCRCRRDRSISLLPDLLGM